MTPFEYHYFDCDCSHFNHVVRFEYDPNDKDLLWIEVHLSLYLPWYKRLWHAVRYVAGMPKAYSGHYDTTLLTIDDRKRLIALLQRSLP